MNFLFSFALVTLLFAMIYKILPAVRIAWRDVDHRRGDHGAAVQHRQVRSSACISATARIASSYGAAGSVILVLVWVYYSAQIFLLGAEFTKVYAHRYGSRRGLTATIPLSRCLSRRTATGCATTKRFAA